MYKILFISWNATTCCVKRTSVIVASHLSIKLYLPRNVKLMLRVHWTSRKSVCPLPGTLSGYIRFQIGFKMKIRFSRTNVRSMALFLLLLLLQLLLLQLLLLLWPKLLLYLAVAVDASLQFFVVVNIEVLVVTVPTYIGAVVTVSESVAV